MKLKTAFLINALLFFLIIILTGSAVAKESVPSSKTVIEQTTFEFPPVIAGTDVTHRFSVLNKGNAPLNIPGVYTG